MPKQNTVEPGLIRPASNQNVAARDEEIVNDQVVMPRIQDNTDRRPSDDFGIDLSNAGVAKGGCFGFARFCARTLCPSFPESPSRYGPASIQLSETGVSYLPITDSQPEPEPEPSTAQDSQPVSTQESKEGNNQEPESSEVQKSDVGEPEPDSVQESQTVDTQQAEPKTEEQH